MREHVIIIICILSVNLSSLFFYPTPDCSKTRPVLAIRFLFKRLGGTIR